MSEMQTDSIPIDSVKELPSSILSPLGDSAAGNIITDTLPKSAIEFLNKDTLKDTAKPDTTSPLAWDSKPGKTFTPKEKTIAVDKSAHDPEFQQFMSILKNTDNQKASLQNLSKRETDSAYRLFSNYSDYQSKNLIQTAQKDPIPKFKRKTENQMNDAFLVSTIILILLAIWIRLFYGKYMQQIFKASVNYQLSYKLLRDKNLFSKRIFFMLNLLFILAAGLCTIQVLKIKHITLTENAYYDFVLVTGILTFALILRIISSYAVGIIFDNLTLFQEYIHNLFIYNKTFGIVLLPFILVLPFVPELLKHILLYTLFLIAIMYLLLRVVRSIKIILNKDILLFYSILYLCTLEILPILVGAKIFKTLI